MLFVLCWVFSGLAKLKMVVQESQLWMVVFLEGSCLELKWQADSRKHT